MFLKMRPGTRFGGAVKERKLCVKYCMYVYTYAVSLVRASVLLVDCQIYPKSPKS